MTLRYSMHPPAVDVKQNAKPAKQEDATVPSTPVNGRERRRPIVPTASEGGVSVSVNVAQFLAVLGRSATEAFSHAHQAQIECPSHLPQEFTFLLSFSSRKMKN